jgi:hypothetical protein
MKPLTICLVVMTAAFFAGMAFGASTASYGASYTNYDYGLIGVCACLPLAGLVLRTLDEELTDQDERREIEAGVAQSMAGAVVLHGYKGPTDSTDEFKEMRAEPTPKGAYSRPCQFCGSYTCDGTCP